MSVTKELRAGDPCPQCGGEFKPLREPTDAERAGQASRDEFSPLPLGVDTAPKAAREELGALHTCKECGYKTRFPLEGEAVEEESGKKGRKK